MLHLWKTIPRKVKKLKIKRQKKLETIAILLLNTEVHHIVYLIQNLMYSTKLL